MHGRLFFLLGLGLYLTFLSNACIEVDQTFTKIPPGPWRGVLKLDPSAVTPNPDGKPLPSKLNLTFEEVSDGELPFNFEVVYTDDTTFHIVLINGDERIEVPAEDITFGNTRA